jgi:formylmethanofuran dehydrogenase subunit E
MKSKDLLSRPLADVFSIREIEFVEPPYAPLARSQPCARCGEMTMATKMVGIDNGKHVCIPCSEISD